MESEELERLVNNCFTVMLERGVLEDEITAITILKTIIYIFILEFKLTNDERIRCVEQFIENYKTRYSPKVPFLFSVFGVQFHEAYDIITAGKIVYAASLIK